MNVCQSIAAFACLLSMFAGCKIQIAILPSGADSSEIAEAMLTDSQSTESQSQQREAPQLPQTIARSGLTPTQKTHNDSGRQNNTDKKKSNEWEPSKKLVDHLRKTSRDMNQSSDQKPSVKLVESSRLEIALVPPPEPARLKTEDHVISATSTSSDEYEANDVDSNEDAYSINLATVMRLAGAENWQVRLAEERVREAQANLDEAQAAWLPSLNLGVGYTKHDGKIQETNGGVIDVSRNALFVGGGAKIGRSPLVGGGGGPVRLFSDLSLSDALFKPLAAMQLVRAERFRRSATHNDTLLDASLAYYSLIYAQRHLDNIADVDLPNMKELQSQTQTLVAAGKGAPADETRVNAEFTRTQQAKEEAEMRVKVAVVELARILQLDAQTILSPIEKEPVGVQMVLAETPLAELVSMGLENRPEITEDAARVEARATQVRSEQVRPFIPRLFVGASGGVLGGGKNGSIDGLDGRGDFDIVAVWELANLGFGNKAWQDRRQSQHTQAKYVYHQTRDRIASEVTKAFHQVNAMRNQIDLAKKGLNNAEETYEHSKTRISALEGLPLEALHSVKGVAEARNNNLRAIIDYNQAQLRLLHAVGGQIENEK